MRAPLVALLTIGCAAPVGGHGAPITEGAATAGDPAVVFVDASLDCSGTLIAPDVVLTAAHCGAQLDPLAVRVAVGSSREGAATVGLRDAVAHPSFDDSADHDLALLLLDAPLEVEPVALDEAGAVGEPPPVAVRIVGFGVSAAGAGDDGTKREGTSVTAELTPLFVELDADPSLPCNGDSGGPVFVGERLAGVISRGDALCEVQGKATRVDAHLDSFIRPQLAAWAAGEVRGAFGASCETGADCLSAECSAARLCSARCVSGRGDCPEGFACEHEGSTDFLCAPESGGGRCSAGGAGSPVPWLTLLALVATRVRRRS